MQSPFPGMDPYTEARYLWKGLHTQLIGELSTHQLPPLLAPAYYVDAESSLQVHSGREVYPDIQVVTESGPTQLHPAGLGLPVAEATAAIAITPAAEEEEEEESAIFIREAATEQLVVVIEILSYSNKTGDAEKRARYLLKRRELLSSGIHLVEVDLLRWGQRVAPALPDQPYHILVSRAGESRSRVWSFGLAEPIPTAPVPLIAPDEYVPLPLQEACTIIYAARGFRQRLDYQAEPEEPLTAAQRAYIRDLLA